jgi:hypothetical protein
VAGFSIRGLNNAVNVVSAFMDIALEIRDGRAFSFGMGLRKIDAAPHRVDHPASPRARCR